MDRRPSLIISILSAIWMPRVFTKLLPRITGSNPFLTFSLAKVRLCCFRVSARLRSKRLARWNTSDDENKVLVRVVDTPRCGWEEYTVLFGGTLNSFLFSSFFLCRSLRSSLLIARAYACEGPAAPVVFRGIGHTAPRSKLIFPGVHSALLLSFLLDEICFVRHAKSSNMRQLTCKACNRQNDACTFQHSKEGRMSASQWGIFNNNQGAFATQWRNIGRQNANSSH